MISKSLKDTQNFAEVFAKDLITRGLGKGATVVGLHGDLGSGKTTFVQSVAKYFGVTEHIQSPTFVIMKSYKLQVTSYKVLIHIDAYRLDSAEEIKKLGWEEIISNPQNLVLIEWPEKIGDAMPKDSIDINFTFLNETEREIKINF